MKFTLRIKKNYVFKYVFKKGEYSKGDVLVVHICKTKNENMRNFFAVCVSKKNGKSVHRNKMKRWAREVYKLQENQLKKNYNIIVVYKKSVVFDNINYSLVENDIINCFKELKLYE
ncbi:MAG: ribonuclease P protein component [Clostridia bacterium]|nr:ribonuclease P protein component [Clostridia bacterium]